MSYSRKTKISHAELFWYLTIFTAITFSVISSALSYTFSLPPKKMILVGDGLISVLFIVDAIKRFLGRKKLAKQHLLFRSGKIKNLPLIVDLIACVPFEIVFHLGGFAKISALFGLLGHLKMIKIINLLPVILNLIYFPRALKIQIILLSGIMILNWIACGWSIINPMEYTDIYTYYNKSLYWAITTLTTIGYGDITPHSNAGRLYTMLIMILGVGLYGIVIGNVSRMLAIADKHKDLAREKIQDLNLFMKHYQIPERLQDMVFSYYNHLYSKKISHNDSHIVSELPSALKTELTVYMNIKMIQNVPIFKLCTQECLREIVLHLEQVFLLPGHNIGRNDRFENEMFIVKHGLLDVIRDGKTVSTLEEGQVFGVEGFLIDQCPDSKTDIIANSYCDLYKLSRRNFNTISSKYPELPKNMKKAA